MDKKIVELSTELDNMRLQVTEIGINEEVQVKVTKAVARDNEELRLSHPQP